MRSPSHSHTRSQQQSDLDRRPRRGTVVVLAALFMVALLGMVAFAVDLGYILKVQTDLDRSVDAAVLAGAGELIRGQQYAEDRMLEYLARNPIGPQVVVSDSNLTQLKDEFKQLQGKTGDDGHPLLQLNVGRWDNTTNSVVPVSGGQKASAVGLSLTHSNHPYFFGRVFGKSTFAVQSAAAATYQPRDIVLVLDYSASMNDDSELGSISTLGRSVVEGNLLQIYQDLGSPSYGKMAFTPVSISSTNATTIKNTLGLTNVPYPYPAGSWTDYFSYVQTSSVLSSAGYNKKYGYLTLINYWLEKYPGSTQVPTLWQTREQPIGALKDSVTVFLDYLQAGQTDDHLGLAVYDAVDGNAKLEKTLGTDFAGVDYISKHRQAGHYHEYTNIGAGLWKALTELKQPAQGGHARPNSFRLVVLMTDGKCNWYNGSYNEAAARQDLLNAANACAAEGIPVVTISLGSKADPAIMQQVADITDGRAFVIPGGKTASQYTAELTDVFKAIADSHPLKLVQ
ncbi:MAG: VWA domain-containing protein [Pirellulales bacterium]